MPKSGDPAMKYVQTAVTHVQLKPGVFGIKVSIMPPNVKLPDEIEFIEKEELKEEIPSESEKREEEEKKEEEVVADSES